MKKMLIMTAVLIATAATTGCHSSGCSGDRWNLFKPQGAACNTCVPCQTPCSTCYSGGMDEGVIMAAPTGAIIVPAGTPAPGPAGTMTPVPAGR